MVLKAYECVLANWQGANSRFRIEHCSLVNPGLLEGIKATGTISAPFYTYAPYHGDKRHEIAVLRTIPGGEDLRSQLSQRGWRLSTSFPDPESHR